MEIFNATAVAICDALQAHGVTAKQLEALRTSDPAIQALAKEVARLVAPNGEMSYKLLYPTFNKEGMPSIIRNALIRNGIADVGCLQIYTSEELQHIPRVGHGALRIIKEYLEQRELRLRNEGESQHERLRDVYPDARLIPVLFLPTEADELKLYGIHTYGDLADCKKSELIKLKLKSSYEGDSSLCFTRDDVNTIEVELNFFDLSFIPEE